MAIKVDPIIATIDLETGGTGIDCIIYSVGCVIGNVLTGEKLGKFYRRVDLTEQQNRTRTESTAEWWQKQRKDYPLAYEECFNPKLKRSKLSVVLKELYAFFEHYAGSTSTGYVEVFGNGPEFDNAILENAATSFGYKNHWNYNNNQSLRTAIYFGRLLLNFDPKWDLPFNGTRHIAIDDAEHEFEYLHAIMAKFQACLVIDPPY